MYMCYGPLSHRTSQPLATFLLLFNMLFDMSKYPVKSNLIQAYGMTRMRHSISLRCDPLATQPAKTLCELSFQFKCFASWNCDSCNLKISELGYFWAFEGKGCEAQEKAWINFVSVQKSENQRYKNMGVSELFISWCGLSYLLPNWATDFHSHSSLQKCQTHQRRADIIF